MVARVYSCSLCYVRWSQILSPLCFCTGREPVEDSCGEDADRCRRGIRVLLAAAVRRQRPHLLRSTPERRRRRILPTDADRHPSRPVDRSLQLRRQSGRLLSEEVNRNTVVYILRRSE